MSEPIVSMEFGGCGADEESRQEAMRELHDRLIDRHPVRLGPVEWRFYAPDAARDILQDAGVLDQPNAAGLLAFLASEPDTELIVATVLIPAVPTGATA